ncbi:MAG: hypothetical protein NUV75_13460 [Gallionella sp.]|nr:hypothetical protein [Gallionella sp.]
MADGCLGCLYIETAPVTLRDGRVVCSSCEDWRLETEARMVVKMEGKAARAEYLQGVEKQRGKAAGDLLRDEVREQWKTGKL